MNYDLISCICITKNRSDLISRSINCFRHQTYPNRELIIIDTGNDNTKQIVESYNDNRIKYIREDDNLNLGQLRNLSIQKYSSAPYFIQWDDDDWFHPQRIETQLKEIKCSIYDCCILNRWCVACPDIDLYGIAFYRTYEGSICAKRNPQLFNYSETVRGEDNDMFVEAMKKNVRIKYLDMPHLYIYYYSTHNTWYKANEYGQIKAMLTSDLQGGNEIFKGTEKERIKSLINNSISKS